MKPSVKNTLIFLWISALLLSTSAAQAAGDALLQLSAKNPKLKVGQLTTVEVLVKNAPPIYGADIQLAFDPTLLEVVDADPNQVGIQVKSGDFLNSEESFSLQHTVDNEKGIIDFAQTLLNPAPAAKGKGRLTQITFRARAEGETIIIIQDGLFGTQTGETIVPKLEGVAIRISGIDGQNQSSFLDEASTIHDQIRSKLQNPPMMAVVAIGLVGFSGAGVMVGRYWFKRFRTDKSTHGPGKSGE